MRGIMNIVLSTLIVLTFAAVSVAAEEAWQSCCTSTAACCAIEQCCHEM